MTLGQYVTATYAIWFSVMAALVTTVIMAARAKRDRNKAELLNKVLVDQVKPDIQAMFTKTIMPQYIEPICQILPSAVPTGFETMVRDIVGAHMLFILVDEAEWLHMDPQQCEDIENILEQKSSGDLHARYIYRHGVIFLYIPFYSHDI